MGIMQSLQRRDRVSHLVVSHKHYWMSNIGALVSVGITTVILNMEITGILTVLTMSNNNLKGSSLVRLSPFYNLVMLTN